MFEQTQEPYLKEIFEEVQRKGVRQAIIVRTGAALFLGIWFLSTSSAILYHLMLLGLFIILGVVYLLFSRTPYHSSWQAYLLVFMDTLLLSLALLTQPGTEVPTQTYLQGQGFLYYFALLSLSVLFYIPGVVMWSAFSSIITWSLGQFIFVPVPQSGDLPEALTQALPQEIFIMLICGGVISAAVWQLRYLMYRQILVEREFYDILAAERAGRDEEDSEIYADPLTGLGTRAAFERDSTQFTKVFAEGRLTDLTIAIIDVEGHAAIQENRGREEYERMLKGLAQSMRRTFRSSDMAYRFGEDQFALLAPGSSMSNAERLHSLLRTIIQQVHEQGFPEVEAKMGLSTLHEVQNTNTQEIKAEAVAKAPLMETPPKPVGS